MAATKDGISAEIFYGPKSAMQARIEGILMKSKNSGTRERSPAFMSRLLGPSRTWKVFKKQNEAINFCLERRNGLMCFAFEQIEGQRLFLVAHPKVFWAVNSHRFFKDLSTYEIIQEYRVCKLYLDIEYEYEYNASDHNGDRMLNNFLYIINFNLHDFYGLTCTMNDILNLDSSNEKKYSHHIIYQIPNIAFQNNYAVGNFVLGLCNELKKAYASNIPGCKDEIKSVADKYKLNEEDILELFVNDCKGRTKLFVDEGVYTKNRHFRLFGSTKVNKNSPLIVSENNKYWPQVKDSSNINIFLDSLITYFSTDINRIIECHGVEKSKSRISLKQEENTFDKTETSCFAYPEVDNFIKGLILPIGGIRRKSYLNGSSKIIYDIYGYRYCENIKRHHKSNNIMFIVDLCDMTYYQKCYDPDCSNFKSNVKHLPEEVCFHLGDDSYLMDFDVVLKSEELGLSQDKVLEENEICERDLIEMLSCVELLMNDVEV